MVADTCPQVAITILKNLTKNIQCYSIDLNKRGIDYLHFCQLALRTFEGGSPEVKKAEMDFISLFAFFHELHFAKVLVVWGPLTTVAV